MKQNRIIIHDNGELPYLLVRNRRKHMAIYVLPDGSVELRVPKRCSLKEAEAFLLAEVPSITIKQQQCLERGVPEPVRYMDGSFHYFLGEQYEITQTGKGRPGALVFEGKLLVNGPRLEDEVLLEDRLERWYRKQAGIIFQQRMEICAGRFEELPVDDVSVKPWKMKSKWGTCRQSGKINLNQGLVKYPVELIDYVLCHELVHLFEFNHSKRFYRLLENALPDWREREERLNSLSWRIQ